MTGHIGALRSRLRRRILDRHRWRFGGWRIGGVVLVALGFVTRMGYEMTTH
jgi:hypothetical protein